MVGTIVNTGSIIVGTLLGALLHRGIKERYRNVLYDGLGLASLAIGLNATIREFLSIGDYATLGAGAVLTKNIPSNEIWIGNPAKFLRYAD